MSINNREDANKYYQQINSLVDDYIDKWKVRPSNLKNYLKPDSERRKRFLVKNNLSELNGVDRVLNDILDDRSYMESDGVYTFESFKYFESNDFKIDSLKQCLYKGIEKSDINSEKILADFFDVNLGDIDIIDSEKHKFKVKDWQNDDWNVVVYSEEDINLIKSNIIEHLYEKISQQEIDLVGDIKINLEKLINVDSFSEKLNELISDSKLHVLISTTLGEDWSYSGKLKDFYIWIS